MVQIIIFLQGYELYRPINTITHNGQIYYSSIENLFHKDLSPRAKIVS